MARAPKTETVTQEWTPAPDEWNGVVLSSSNDAVDFCVLWHDAECAELERLSETKAAKARAEYLEKMPAKIKLLRLHGYIDENNTLRQWPAGSVITNRDEIIHLSDRKATFEVI